MGSNLMRITPKFVGRLVGRLVDTDNLPETEMEYACGFSMKMIAERSQPGIQDVWQSNLEEEFRNISRIHADFNYVAMDTEFPGVVAKPTGEFKSSCDFQYQMMKCNVDILKVIQVGLTLFDEQGNTPAPIASWQFNLKFNLETDMFAQDSVELLRNSGIDFLSHKEYGIEASDFGEHLMTSGLVLNENIKWISFHSIYDFGYMVKILTSCSLPQKEDDFLGLVKEFFPNLYDVKYLMTVCNSLKGGLQEMAEQVDVKRTGVPHQAGSDSLLTGATFFQMKEKYFQGKIDDEKFCGRVSGFGYDHFVLPASSSSDESLWLSNDSIN